MTHATPLMSESASPEVAGVQVVDGRPRYFHCREIDDTPTLLEQSFGMRYQVYCLERAFLNPDHYPNHQEVDVFDAQALHFGTMNLQGELVGTARLVQDGLAGFPLLLHCTIFPDETEVYRPGNTVVEVSRLSVSKKYRRRKDDGAYGDQGAPPPATRRERRGEHAEYGGELIVSLYKALYQASKRRGITHWLAATEKSLHRLLAKYAFPLRLIGPETDYFGPVSPYLMDVSEFDEVILSHTKPILDDFLVGLEPQFLPLPRGGHRPIHRSRQVVAPDAETRLLTAFRRAATNVAAYRTLLDEHGAVASKVVDSASFSRLCPVTSKRNTFNRFDLEQMCVTGGMRNLAGVLTSSGHGGRFAFGLSTREQTSGGASFIDEVLDAAFQVRTRSTLAINCLPMGVGFSSHVMTVATTSVREDMALGLVRAFGGHYDQILLVGDPLFLKRLTDRARTDGMDWSRYRINVVVGEEIFGEHFRTYLATCLGLDVDRPQNGYIMSSFGVGELGLHLCYETPATIAVHRAASTDQGLARELLAGDEAMPPPMIFAFNPLRTFIEIVEPDQHGYGLLTMSMLDDATPLPLMRYQTGDVARLLDTVQVADLVARRGIVLPSDLPPLLLALKGRDRDALPNGSQLSVYKDALYADCAIARQLSGAFRLVFSGTACTMHVQLAADAAPEPMVEQTLLRQLPDRARPTRLVLWPYARFPFGMGLDYERKFSHYVNGERNPC
jgi:phenylacetate-CoA ligase